MDIVKTKPQASKFVYDKWFAKYGLSENATVKEKNLWWGKETNEYWSRITPPRFTSTFTFAFP